MNNYDEVMNNIKKEMEKMSKDELLKYLDDLGFRYEKKDNKKNMESVFNNLAKTIFTSLDNTDLKKINYELERITTKTLTVGVGGSSIVALFAQKILEQKNNIITRSIEPRDFNYFNYNLYNNILICSFSANNYGVELVRENNLKHYLLSSKEIISDDIINLTYDVEMSEKSFISLDATLIPCSILLNYYLDNEKARIIDNLDSYSFDFDVNCDAYEIFSGLDTSVASKYLESTMVEAGIGIPIIHDKYSYCHGRSTTSFVNNNIAIYFNTFTELDKLLLEEISKYYKDVIVIDTKSDLFSEYLLLIKCMYLTKYIAQKKQIDLVNVNYNPIVKKLYRYKGNL